MATAHVHDLGPELGTLLEVFPEAAGAPAPAPPLHLILLMDKSGSMGTNAPLIVNTHLPDACAEAGIPPHTTLDAIMFDSAVRWVRSTVGGLRAVPATADGSTYMSPAVRELAVALVACPPEQAAVVLVLSDGEVADAQETVDCAAQHAPVARRTAGQPTVVCGFHVCPSGVGQGDTRAMACVSAFDTSTGADLVPMETWTRSGGRAVLVRSLRAALDRVSARPSWLTLAEEDAGEEAAFTPVPGFPPCTRLRVAAGSPTLAILRPGVDPSCVRLDGRPLSLTTGRWSPDTLERYAGLVEGRLRTSMVTGFQDGEAAAAIAWFKAAAAAAAAPSVADPEEELPHPKARDHAQRILARLKRATATGVDRILALANAGRVSALNAAQQAAFLRGTTTSTALARRALKTDEALDFDQLARGAVDSLAALRLPPVRAAPVPASFLTMDGWRDGLDGAARELQPASSQVTAPEVLQVVGGLGLAFSGPRGDFPDPWYFWVDEVYPSQSLYLNEADVARAARAGAVDTLKMPGADAPVTGVVPLRVLDAYDAYTGHATGLADLHAGYHMRGLLARVPFDRLARDAAALVCLTTRPGWDRQPTAAEAGITAALLEQLGAGTRSLWTTSTGDALVAGLCSPAPGRCFLGIAGVGSGLKPLLALLVAPGAAPARSDPAQRQSVLRAVVEFQAYLSARRLRRSGGQDAEAGRLLGDEGDGASPPSWWKPAPTRIARLGRFLAPQSPPACWAEALGVEDGPAYLRAVAVRALRTQDEEGRLGWADLATLDSCEAYLASVRAAVAAAAAAAAAAALRQEQDTAYLQAMLSPVGGDAAFVNLLTRQVPNRHVALYARLETGLVDLLRSGSPDAAEFAWGRLWTLWTGQVLEVDGLEWAAGVAAGPPRMSTSKMATLLRLLPTEEARVMFGEVVVRRLGRQGGGPAHTYRKHAGPNRHGHSNAKPSFWALGYDTLELFRHAVGPDVYASYAVAHRGCCGFPRA